MSPPPHQVRDLHNTTTTTHFQHSDDAQKSGISKKKMWTPNHLKALWSREAGRHEMCTKCGRRLMGL
jgi:hypothetical protein